MSEVTICPARRHELAPILKIYADTFRKHRTLVPEHFSDPKQQRAAARAYGRSFTRWGLLPRRTSTGLFVARKAGSFVGYVFFWPQGPNMLIRDIYVIPPERRRGIARQLLAHATKISMARGYSQMDAVVWRGNHASEALFENQQFCKDFKVYSLRRTR